MTTPNYSDIEALLDAVPTISAADLNALNKPAAKRPRLPAETTLQIFLEWHRGRRIRWSERRSMGLTARQIGQRYGVSSLACHQIGHRQRGWKIIRSEVVALLSNGEAQFLLEPMLSR